MKNGRSRVCLVLVIDDLGYGGAERQVVELANHLDTKQFDIHVCALSAHVPLRSKLIIPSSNIHIIETNNKYDVTLIFRLARLLKEVKAGIVHGFLFTADMVSRLAGFLAGTPIVIGSERNSKPFLNLKKHILHKVTQPLVDLVIANSRAGMKNHQRFTNYSSSKYRVIYNGVDVSNFKPGFKRIARSRLGISDKPMIVGSFANFKVQKNHTMLFRAFRHTLDELPEARLLLVGGVIEDKQIESQKYRAEIEKTIDKLDIRHACIFLGHRSDVANIYPACDVVVLSSLYEGTPNVLLEAMACGIPVIATDVSDNRFVIQENRTGYLIPLGNDRSLANRINLLFKNEELRIQMGCQARKVILEHFTTGKLADRAKQVYLESCQKRYL